MKLFIIAGLSWLISLLAILLLSTFWFEPPSLADVLGFGGLSFLAALFVIPLLYLPALWWLKRKLDGLKPAMYFPLTLVSAFNAPVYILLWIQAGKAFMASEGALFFCLFFVMGLVFGNGFVWNEKQKVKHTKVGEGNQL